MAQVTPEGKLLNLIKQTQGRLRFRKELKVFTKINVILVAIIVVILAVFLVDILTSNYNIPELTMDIPVPAPVVDVVPEPDLFDEYIEDIKIGAERNVSVSKEEVKRNLTLLGIITGDDNQAIIEDKKLKKTFFLYKGDSFGEFSVEDIKDSEVILDYKGEKIDLHI